MIAFIEHARAVRVRTRTVLAAGLALTVATAACDRPMPTEVPFGAATLLSNETTSKTVLVGFHSAPGDLEAAWITSLGGQVTHRYKYIPVFAASIPLSLETVLAEDARVSYVEDDLSIIPFGGKQVMDWGVFKVQAPAAWALGYRGQGIKVGVFDSGIDVDHPDLSVAGGVDLVGDGNGLDDCQGHGTHVAGIVGAKNNGNHTVGVAPHAQLYSMRFADCNWAGATLAKMIQGVEWAIDNGMRIVNMSFGFGIAVAGVGGPSPLPPGSTSVPPSRAAEDAFAAAHARGIVLIAASGNGTQGTTLPFVSYPAAYPTVIAVGATDDEDNLATFSQWGTEQDLTAPGVTNLSSWLVGLGQLTTLTVASDNGREVEVAAMLFSGTTGRRGFTAGAVYAGFGTFVEFESVDCAGKIAVVSRGGTSFAEKAVDAMNAGCAALIIHNHSPGNFAGTLGTETAPDGRPWIPVVSTSLDEGLYLKEQIESRATRLSLLNGAGNLRIASGTSMASPHAAGVAALVLSKNPMLLPEQVRAILRNSADDLGAPGWDPVFGAGRVNALRAVQLTP
jgi:serine protease